MMEITRRVNRGSRNIYDRIRATLNCGNVGAMTKATGPRDLRWTSRRQVIVLVDDEENHSARDKHSESPGG